MPDNNDNDEVVTQLVSFGRQMLETGDLDTEIDAATPLLELGLLDSLKIAKLLNFIRTELHVVVPPADMSADNFKDMRSVAALVAALSVPTMG